MIEQAAALCVSLILNEGVRSQTYLDSEGFLTGGIGHKITQDDPEFNMPVGTFVEQDRIAAWFVQDCARAERGAKAAVPFYDELPTEVRHILVEMAYQMGDSGLRKFKKMIAALKLRDYDTAAAEMIDSKWYRQTPVRCQRLSNEMSSHSIPF